MTQSARLFVGSVLAIGLGLVISAFTTPPPASQVVLLTVLLVAASVAQLSKAEAPNHTLIYATPVFLFAGAILLAPPFFVLLVAFPHLCEWMRERWHNSPHLSKWYLQPFNICKHLIAGFATHRIMLSLVVNPQHPNPTMSLLGLTVAGIVYVGLNQLLLGQVLVVARAATWRTSGVFDFDTLLPEGAMICTGALIVAVWPTTPWLFVLAVAPLALIYRTLVIPKLKHDAQTDAKTGLANAGHFSRLFHEELQRALQFKRPLSLLMADLDFLRTINNTYGHLAGDEVLTGVGRAIQLSVRDGDIAARFGGEEFAIILLETSPADALVVAERIRQSVEAMSFTTMDSTKPFSVTISLGIATAPMDGATTTSLIHAADGAVYQAKAQGRNRVISAVDVPIALRTQPTMPTANALKRPSVRRKPISRAVEPAPPPSAGIPIAPAAETAATTQKDPAVSVPAGGERTTGERRHRSSPALPVPAWIFVLLVLISGLAVSLVAWSDATAATGHYVQFGLLLFGATFAQLYKVDGPNHELFHPAPVFLFAGVLLLPLHLFVLLVVIPHFLEWAKERWRRSPHLNAWYLQPFNMAMYIISGFVAERALAALSSSTGNLHISPSLMIAVVTILVYVGTNQIILGLILRLARGISWRDSQVLTSGLVTEAVLASLGFLIAQQWHQDPWLAVVVLAPLGLIYRALSIPKLQAENMQALQQMNMELSQANQSIHQLNDELFLTLAKIFDARDPYVGGHAAQVAAYAVAVAKELGLPAGQVEVIRQAGYLHDIGKMAIPESILHKASKLTDEEFEIIKTHAAIGAEFLETSQGLRHLAPFVRHHHERWDGRGYPDRLSGDAIPLVARILNVCDSVEAMASDRPYHTGMSVEAIIAEVQRCSGTQFDPAVTEIFVRIADRDGSRFVVNSARAVQQMQQDALVPPISSSGLVFAKVYHQVS